MQKYRFLIISLMAIAAVNIRVQASLPIIMEVSKIDPIGEQTHPKSPLMPPSVSLEDHTLYFETPCDGCTLYTTAVSLEMSDEPNKIPYIVNPNQNDFYFIQNDTIQEKHIFRGNVVKVGTDVTDIIPHGNVVFDGGKTTIIGKEVTIKGETTIKQGTEFEIKNE